MQMVDDIELTKITSERLIKRTVTGLCSPLSNMILVFEVL